MTVSVTTEWKYRDLQTVIMENERLKVVILPELGAKIWELHYKPRSKQLLWQHPRIRPRLLPYHSVYDDTFFGGWDELFPNDIPEAINGETEPDHGEIWLLPWEVRIEKDTPEEATVCLRTDTAVASSRVEKRITLRAGESKLRFRHKITNTGGADLPFLWKLHAAMNIDEHCRIDMPAGRVSVQDFGPTRFGETGTEYDWPFYRDGSGEIYDMRTTLPSSAKVNEFQMAMEMKEGWCALTHTRERLGFGLAFDPAVLPSCWTFASYGGWRNLNTLILEPCTGYPLSVNEGAAAGTHQTLKAGASLETEIVAVVYEGLSEVASIDRDGRVTGR
jgi:galactose mutarotase-like enzyme